MILPKSWQTRIIEQLTTLQTNPRPEEAFKLPDFENIYRFDADYRLFYQVQDDTLQVTVVKADLKIALDTV